MALLVSVTSVVQSLRTEALPGVTTGSAQDGFSFFG